MAGPRTPNPAPGPAPPAARAYLRASPAKQGEGELADGDNHQVHPQGPPGGAGALGAPHRSAWGLRQAENAETPLEGIHGVALSGPVGGVFRAAEVVLVVQDKALRADQAWQATAGQGPGARVPAVLPAVVQPRQQEPAPASPGGASRWAAASPPGPPGGG